ncbi:alpha/beta hydrolase [Paenibacillus sp. P26]|nr:alpha/beta hydrolase [Paenibacillus sp. P26]
MLAVAAVLVLFLIALWVLSQRGSRRMDKKARADAPGRMIRLNQGYTHVVEEGPADGTVIVLIPGATLPLWIWKDLPKTLVDKGYRVIRYDLYGRGYSDRPYGRYDQNLFVRRLHELLQALRIHRPVHLAGLAFGRLIACEFARSHPELAGRVILIGADGFGVRMTAGDRMKFWPVIGDFLMQIAGNKRLMDRLNGYTPKEELREWSRRNFEPELAFRGFKRALLSSVRNMPIHDARSLYAEVDRRFGGVLVIWGRDDLVTPPPDEEELTQTFPNSKVILFDQVGHLPHVERLAETGHALVQYLEAQ